MSALSAVTLISVFSDLGFLILAVPNAPIVNQKDTERARMLQS
jgi:hypothetical protein